MEINLILFKNATSAQVSNTRLCQILPNFGKIAKLTAMSTMNISLPDELKAFVDQRIQADGYGTSSEIGRASCRERV